MSYIRLDLKTNDRTCVAIGQCLRSQCGRHHRLLPGFGLRLSRQERCIEVSGPTRSALDAVADQLYSSDN
jgi:hypothetical protein